LTNDDEQEIHQCTHWKLCWFDELLMLNDKRYFSKIQHMLELIIENSKFSDLVIRAKIMLAKCYQPSHSFILNLYMGCISKHFGYLPELFKGIVCSINVIPELKNGNNKKFNFLKRLYFQCKNLILDKNCAFNTDVFFVDGAVEFLTIWRRYKYSNSLEKEIYFIRNYLIKPFLQDSKLQKFLMPLAETSRLLNHHEEALEEIKKFQEWHTSTFGNDKEVLIEIYTLQMDCHIALKNKKMAQKCLKRLKPFQSHMKNRDEIKSAQKLISKLKIKKRNKFKQEKTVRKKTKCSAYGCEKTDMPGDKNRFLCCSKCKIAYYCSKKCQAQHWKDIHKTECKQKRKKNDAIAPKIQGKKQKFYLSQKFIKKEKMIF